MLDFDPSRAPVPPRDAATVLLLRDVPGGFEVLMVRRAAQSGFMGGAHVFPGGKVDAADAADGLLARTTGRTADEARASLGEDDASRSLALFVAAIRETFEEAGVLLATHAPDADLGAARLRAREGASFADVVDALDARLRLDALVPQARWVTPRAETRRFDARFFLARAPEGQHASADAHETTREEWLAPSAALDRHARGDIVLPPPTLCTIEWLAAHGTIDAALRDAASRTPPRIEPVFAVAEPLPTLALPGDPLHDVAEPALPGPTRVVLRAGIWRREGPIR